MTNAQRFGKDVLSLSGLEERYTGRLVLTFDFYQGVLREARPACVQTSMVLRLQERLDLRTFNRGAPVCATEEQSILLSG